MLWSLPFYFLPVACVLPFFCAKANRVLLFWECSTRGCACQFARWCKRQGGGALPGVGHCFPIRQNMRGLSWYLCYKRGKRRELYQVEIRPIICYNDSEYKGGKIHVYTVRCRQSCSLGPIRPKNIECHEGLFAVFKRKGTRNCANETRGSDCGYRLYKGVLKT